MKNEFSHWVKEFQDNLNVKADIETVKTLGASLEDKIDEVIKALQKQFADKSDTRKALKLLEKNLKHMYDLFMNKGTQDNEDDAMFTKKPLGGTSCASCAKDVIDMYGKRVEYMPWGRLPFRDPSDRIARVGQGFSKMLSMMNPDHLSKIENPGQHDGGVTQLQEAKYRGTSGNLPPHGKMHGNFGHRGSGYDPNRPSSAQNPKNRPFVSEQNSNVFQTRGGSKPKGRGYQ